MRRTSSGRTILRKVLSFPACAHSFSQMRTKQSSVRQAPSVKVTAEPRSAPSSWLAVTALVDPWSKRSSFSPIQNSRRASDTGATGSASLFGAWASQSQMSAYAAGSTSSAHSRRGVDACSSMVELGVLERFSQRAMMASPSVGEGRADRRNDSPCGDAAHTRYKSTVACLTALGGGRKNDVVREGPGAGAPSGADSCVSPSTEQTLRQSSRRIIAVLGRNRLARHSSTSCTAASYCSSSRQS